MFCSTIALGFALTFTGSIDQDSKQKHMIIVTPETHLTMEAGGADTLIIRYNDVFYTVERADNRWMGDGTPIGAARYNMEKGQCS